MIRLLIRAAIFVGTAALGLLVASVVLPDVQISLSGFLVSVGVFALAQSILAPFIFNMARQYAPAMLGGIGLVSTFVALLIASLVPGGLTITGISTWVLATLVVWIVTALGGWLLPLLLLKNRVSGRVRARDDSPPPDAPAQRGPGLSGLATRGDCHPRKGSTCPNPQAPQHR